MPSLLIKNIDHKLLADVNHAAAVAEINQRLMDSSSTR